MEDKEEGIEEGKEEKKMGKDEGKQKGEQTREIKWQSSKLELINPKKPAHKTNHITKKNPPLDQQHPIHTPQNPLTSSRSAAVHSSYSQLPRHYISKRNPKSGFDCL